MPKYIYYCSKCDLKFEKTYKIEDYKKPTDCPNCGNLAEKVITAPYHIMSESKKIPKEIDLAIGKDAEKRWLDYEDRKNKKEKVKKQYGTEKLSRDLECNYSPLEIKKGDTLVSEKEGIELRKDSLREFNKIINDPTTEKVDIKD